MSGDAGSRAFRLSPQQRRLWELSQGGPAQRTQWAVRIAGDLDAGRLRDVLEAASLAHEILRTSFSRPEGMKLPAQVVHDLPRISWHEEAQGSGPGEDEAGFEDEVFDEEGRFELDPAQGPALRARLASLDPDRHLLVLTLPALCADPWSLGLLLREVADRYEAATLGLPWEREIVPYVQVSEWQNELLEGEDAEPGRAFWRAADLPRTVPRLPFEQVRENGGKLAPRAVAVPLAPDLASCLALGRDGHGSETSLRAFLIAAWLAFLARVTEEPEIVVGEIWHGREHEVLQGVIGPLATCLPVAAWIDGDLGLRAVAGRVERWLAERSDWQEHFRIEDAVAPPAPAGEVAGFRVGIEIEEREPEPAAAGVRFEVGRWRAPQESFALKLACVRDARRLWLELGFDPRRFGDRSVARLAGQFATWLANAVAAPETPVRELSLLGEEEASELVFGLNRTRLRHPESDLEAMLSASAERFADRPAVICGDVQASHDEVFRRSNRLARHLRELGVGPEVPVALYLDRSVEMVVALVAVLKAGGAYSPLDLEAPPGRVAALLAGLKPRVILTRRELTAKLPETPAQVVDLDAAEAAIADRPSGRLAVAVPDRSLAYVLFTSGSTGTPKGVGVERAQIVNYLQGVGERLGLPEGASYAMVSTFAADLGNTSLYPALATGGTLHLVPADQVSDPEALASLWSERRPDCLKIVPSHLAALLDSTRAERILPAEVLVLGGEAAHWSLIERIRALAPSCRIVNHYGPTEATVGATTYPVPLAEDRSPAVTVPIGRPIANVQIYLLDDRLQPVACGLPGELYIGGDGVARGYLGLPQLTASAFRPDPFADRPGARLYRTGDRARHLPDGDVEFLGRIDHQVKVRGFRIELGEIEAALRADPRVEAAAVSLREDRPGQRYLAAYVVPRKVPPGEDLATLPNGLAVAQLNRNETSHLYKQIFEDEIYTKHGITFPDGACVFDVGANIGLFTLFVHQRCHAPRIFAFEPSPPTFSRLRQNVDGFGLDARIFEAGLSREEGTAQFTHYPRASVMSGFYAEPAREEQLFRTFTATHFAGREDGAELAEQIDGLAEGRFEGVSFTARLTTFSQVLRAQGIETVDLLKVDVEKSELDVFEGIEASDWRKIRQIVVEVHDLDGRVERIAALLLRRGFVVAVDQDSPLQETEVYQLYARRAEGVPLRDGSRQSLKRRGGEPFSPAGLRASLGEKLPEYMVPAAIVALDALPITANGKLDRAALPSPEEARAAAAKPQVAPRTPAEVALAKVWTEVLGVASVGAEDNFFGLGGDSILAIRVIARAHATGLRITPKQVFQHQTLAELAAVAGRREGVAAIARPSVGPIPLTPIQRWFFELESPDSHHFNQAALLDLRRPLDLRCLEGAVGHLVARHEALRFRFVSTPDGPEQVASPPPERFRWVRIDLGALSGESWIRAIEEAAACLQASLDLESGPLLRVAFFDSATVARTRLLIVAHHLVIDGVSWQILLEDLETAYRQLERGAAPELAQTTSFGEWSRRLVELARTPAVRDEIGYWLAAAEPAVAPLPFDLPDGESTVASGETLSNALEAEETTALLQTVPRAYRTQIDDHLLAALLLAFREWTGGTSLWVECEGHGREGLFDEVDLSRTAGWFTTHYPLRLDLGGTADPGAALKAVKELRRGIPNRGIGYGLLRYLGEEEDAARLRRLPKPGVKVNYLGQLDRVLGAESLFVPSAESRGPLQSPRGSRDVPLELRCAVLEGRLSLTWDFSRNLFHRATVERLAEGFLAALRALIAHCLVPGAGERTPSDFPLAGLDSKTFDRLISEAPDLLDVYPLSPLQEGLLFHSLFAPTGGVYVRQLLCGLAGDLDVPALERACAAVVEHHPALRTSFRWHDLPRPLQLVHARSEAAFEHRDWRNLPGDEQERELEKLLDLDREKGFDLTRAPLLRWTLIAQGGGRNLLLWSCHHILFDGWSSGAVSGDLLAAYGELRAGRAPQLPARPPYGAYIAWLENLDLDETERYWRRTLAGWTEPTPLAVAGPVEADGQGPATRTAALGVAPTAALNARARRWHVTPNTLMQAAWGILLGRYAGTEEVVFGVTVSGRPAELPGVESMVGMLINTLPLRLRIDLGRLLLPWLQDIQWQQAELRQHEHSPLSKVQGWSEIPRGRSLFESILVFENFPIDASVARAGAELGVTGVRIVQENNFPLAFVTGPGENFSLGLQYRRSRFDAATIDRMLGHLGNLLRGIGETAEDPAGLTLGELPLLSSGERQQLAFEWRGAPTPFAAGCIHEVFEAAAERHPDAVAVEFGGGALSYRELERRANRLAHHLRFFGVGPEVPVGLCVERSAEMVVAMLAIFKAGGAYVPLDPAYPAERLAFLLNDTYMPVVVGEERLVDALAVTALTQVVLIDADREAIARLSDSRPTSRALAENLACVLYTSGSTGEPKGAGVLHRGVVRLVRETGYADFGRGETFLQLAPISFDASLFEIWGPLLNGGRLVVAPPGSLSLADIARELEWHRVTILWLTAGLFREMVDLHLSGLEGVRQLLAGGEVLAPPQVRRALSRIAGVRLINGYGPTEGTTFTCCHPMTRPEEAGDSVSIGRPIANSEIFLLDGRGDPVPVGVAGELHIGGAGLTRGYLDRPAATAERWVPDGVSGRRGTQLYRSGDLARFLPDGRVEFVGRIDHQVKVRGFRIEPGEIEAALGRHPEVRESLVTVYEEKLPAGLVDRRLVAYVVGREGLDRDAVGAARELRGFLEELLPEHMVPSHFVLLAKLPLTKNGKVDRQALPAPTSSTDAAAFVAPRDPVESDLAAIWADVLGCERIGVKDSFFQLGGHSLRAVRVISAIRERFGVEVPLRVLFEEPTVASLAEWLRNADGAASRSPVPPVRPLPRRGAGQDVFPLSFAQQRLWFLDRFAPKSAAYNVPLAVRFAGPLDAAVLEASLAEIVRRHEVLRTVFRPDSEASGEAVQAIAEAGFRALPRVDLAALRDDAEREVARLVADDAGRPFDLVEGPLFRPVLIRLAAEDQVVLASMHHIVSDAWSIGILIRELVALYGALLERRAAPLPGLPVQYADYSVWQRRWFSEGVLERELAGWRERLAGVAPFLDLPTDRPRPAVRSYVGESRGLRLAQGDVRPLATLALAENATLFMVLLAGFSAVLSRYADQESFAVGTPVAGRGRAEVEGLIGFFVNTLALPIDLSGDPEFGALLGKVRAASLDAFAHQDLPFEKLVEELRPERNLAHSPIFQVALVLQNAPREDFALPGLRLRHLAGDNRAAKFDLNLALTETADGILGTCQFDRDLFDGATIDRLCAHFRALLAAAAAHPDWRLSELPLLSDAERHQLRLAWNDTRAERRSGLTLPGLFAEQAARTPDHPAVTFDGRTISYRDLDRLSGRLAVWLVGLGVRPDSAVGVLMERSIEMVVALWGVLKAGAAYLPLDPEYPAEQLGWILADASVPVLLAQERHLPILPATAARVLCLEAGWEGEGDPAGPGGSSDLGLAYVLYTSGSTGRPKGVMIPHRGIVNRLLWMQEAYGLAAEDRVLQKTPYSFDVSVWEFFWPLITGAHLVVARPGGHRDGAYLAALIGRERITVMHFVPSMLQAFLEVPDLSPCSSLRLVVTSGEALTPELRRRFRERLAAPLENLYGPTEASVDVTAWSCAEEARGGVVPIGRPVANTGIHLLDRTFRLVPIGIPGELAIGGVQLARGYLNRPDLTAERFVPDPSGDAPGNRLYRTGDLARHLPDGAVEYLGRIDQQVKIRGFRIEPGEVEAALADLPGVLEAAVVAREEAGDRFLVAFVTAAEPGTDPRDLHETLAGQLATRLPRHMVPSRFVALDRLPATASGKVDRRALSRWELAPPPRRCGETAAPMTPIQELLAGIFAEVLRLDAIGADEDFFALGGHSLLALQVVSRLRQTFGLEVPLRTLFEASTVAALAERIESALQSRAGTTPPPPIVRIPRDGELPLSFSQQRLWFIDQLEPESPVYNIPTVLRLAGRLNRAVLAGCLAEIVRRQESLRTRFETVDGRPRLAIDPAETKAPPVVDLAGLAGAEREARRLATLAALLPFDLARGPLARVALLRLAAEEHLALFTLHHVIADGWSINVLVQELTSLYRSFRAGRPSTLPEPPVQYVDFAAWQRGWLTGDGLNEPLRYWQQALAGSPALLSVPTDRPRSVGMSPRGRRTAIPLHSAATAEIRNLARRERVTPFMLFLAVLDLVLSRWSGQDDLTVGTPVSGRGRLETESLIGFFVNTIVLRADLSGDPSFRALLARVREGVLLAFAHQDLPFDRLVDELVPERSLVHTPLFQVQLLFQSAPPSALELPELELLPFANLVEPARTVKFDLTLAVDDRTDFAAGLISRRGLFDAATMERMASHFGRALAAAAADPDLRLSDLPLVSEAETWMLLREWNRGGAAASFGGTFHELFERQADLFPEAVAVEHEGERLTYRELEESANALAHRLRALGVGPEVPVGIFLERSLEMIIGLIGVLKAGGAYLPLDLDLPAERLAYMIADSGAPIVLTQRRLLDALPASAARPLCLDDPEPEENRDRPAIPVTRENLIYLIYTSGSTGRPKRVGVEHRQLLGYLAGVLERLSLPGGSSFATVSTLAADLGNTMIFAALATGGALHVIPRARLADAEAMAEYFSAHPVDCLKIVPSHLGALLGSRNPERLLPRRLLMLGGEAVHWPFADALRALAPALRLVNHYGPTETTIGVATQEIESDTAGLRLASATVPLGRPLAGATLYVANAHLRPVPAGVAGELLVGGATVSRGYLGRPELAAEKFVPDPFGTISGGRLYRTGDLVRHLADGKLEFLGRIDLQVKVRGFRVEPREVEIALRSHPEVREAVVLARPQPSGGNSLVGYLVANPEAVPGEGELRDYLWSVLPPYMVPSSFLWLDRLPYTSNGKVDRRALSALGIPQVSAVSSAPARTPVEKTLARIWCEVLGLESVGIDNNFFALGGDSILSIQIVARAHQAGLQLTVRQLFLHQTIAELSRVAETSGPVADDGQGPSGPVPLTDANQVSSSDFPLAGIGQDELADALQEVEFEGFGD